MLVGDTLMDLGEALYKTLIEAKESSDDQEDIQAALDYVYHEMQGELNPTTAELIYAYCIVFETAVDEEEWDIIWHCFKHGYLDASVVVQSLYELFPEESEGAVLLLDTWSSYLIQHNQYVLVFDVMIQVNVDQYNKNIVAKYLNTVVLKLSINQLETRLNTEYFEKLKLLEQEQSAEEVFAKLLENGNEERRLLNCLIVSMPFNIFSSILETHNRLNALFQDKHIRLELFKRCVKSDNFQLLSSYEAYISTPEIGTTLLLEACNSHQDENINFMILMFIKNRWPIDERCLISAPEHAAIILQRGLRIKGGTFAKIKEKPFVANQMLSSLVENAFPVDDEVCELRLKSLIDPNGKYQFESDEKVIELAKNLNKENIVNIFKDNNVSVQKDM